MLFISSLEKLPVSILLLLQFSWVVLGQASQAPPSTFGTATATATSSGNSFSSQSGSVSGSSSRSASGSGSGSVSGSSTATANLPSLSGYSSCVSNCFLLAITDVGCTNVVPESCYCTNPSFPSSLITCIGGQCPTELSTAEGLSNQFCALASTSTSLSFSVTSISSTSSSSPSSASSSLPSNTSGSSSGSSSASASASNNAAIGAPLGRPSHTTMLSLSASFMGVLLGAFIIG